jgi:hypothetical protein
MPSNYESINSLIRLEPSWFTYLSAHQLGTIPSSHETLEDIQDPNYNREL